MVMFPFILAASGSRFSEMVRYLGRAGSSRENLIFLLLAVIIAGIWIALFVWHRMHRTTVARPKGPSSLFEQLCQAHRLDAQDTSLLHVAATKCDLTSPALLFVNPDHLLRLSTADAEHAGGYRQLRERLFGAI